MNIDAHLLKLEYTSTLAALPLHSTELQLDDPCKKIGHTFEDLPHLPGILLFDKKKFHSLLSKGRFLEIMNQPYAKDLFSRRKIKKLVSEFEQDPLQFSADTYIGRAVEESLKRPAEQLTEPLVVVNNQVYFILDMYRLLQAHAQIFSGMVKKLHAEISHSNLLREKLEQANKASEAMARQDGLTGIPNRRHMDEYLTREWQRTLREQSSLSLALIDIDAFKAYNDHYGHQAGDDALARVATCLSRQIHRPADMVARYGGEEFIVILPDTPASGALTLAEKMREAVLALQIEHEQSPVGAYLSISCGIASCTASHSHQLDQVLHCADRALYQAKTNGRNLVMISEALAPDGL